MKHSFIDKYSDRESFLHDRDPRVKLVIFLVFVLAVTLVPFPRLAALGLFYCLWLGLVISSRVPPGYLLGRAALAAPAILGLTIFCFFKNGGAGATFMLLKSFLCVEILVLLVATTPFDRLLRALEHLRFPRLFILILSFMYRYFFVLEDERQRLSQALRCRSFKPNRKLIFRGLANFTGLFFVRSYERSERIYQAMVSRGFNGHLITPGPLVIRGRDFLFGLGMAFIISSGLLLR